MIVDDSDAIARIKRIQTAEDRVPGIVLIGRSGDPRTTIFEPTCQSDARDEEDVSLFVTN